MKQFYFDESGSSHIVESIEDIEKLVDEDLYEIIISLFDELKFEKEEY